MRTFEHFNQSGEDVCPICGTNEDKELVLIPIVGTEDGNIEEAIQVHSQCLQENLQYNKEHNIIFSVCNPGIKVKTIN